MYHRWYNMHRADGRQGDALRRVGIGQEESQSQRAMDADRRRPHRVYPCWDVCDDDCNLCDRYAAMLHEAGSSKPDPVLQSVLYRI